MVPRWSLEEARKAVPPDLRHSHNGDCDFRPGRFRPGCPRCAHLRDARDAYDLEVASIVNARARRTASGSALVAIAIDRWEELDTWACVFCGAPFAQADHVVPHSRGGRDTAANLQPTCGECNGSKKDTDVLDWLNSPRQQARLGVLPEHFRG